MKKNVASQEEVLKITEVRYNTGLVAKLDVAQAKSVLYSTRASIPQLEAGINQYITTLAVLLGMYPQEIRLMLETVGILPDYMEPIGVGIIEKTRCAECGTECECAGSVTRSF